MLQLVDSADKIGYASDLIVVSSALVEVIRQALAQI
jgi:hypothetical protein